jgi:hypothetical protein
VCSGWYVSTLSLLLNTCALCHVKSPDEQQLFAVNGLVHRASTAALTTRRAVTHEEFQAVLYEAGWATLNAMTYADFCAKQPNKIPVRTSTTLRLQRAARVRACVRRLRAYMLVCVRWCACLCTCARDRWLRASMCVCDRCVRACVSASAARVLVVCVRPLGAFMYAYIRCARSWMRAAAGCVHACAHVCVRPLAACV